MSNHVIEGLISVSRNKSFSTPWGPAQSIEPIADGLDFVSTAGHGGYRLSPARQAVLAKRFPEFKPFTGSREWLEEDCDAAIAPILFPECFPAESVKRAEEFVRNYQPYFAACVAK